MSEKKDITYRLRMAYTEEDLDEAADEIERLRGELEAKVEKIRSGEWRDEKIAKQEAEIERLRAERVRVTMNYSAAQEIERLRSALEIEKRYVRQYRDGYCKSCSDIVEMRTEIERLRQVARKLFFELEGDDQFFEGWLARQRKSDE